MNTILLFDLKKIKLSSFDYSILQNNTKDTILLQVDVNSKDILKNLLNNSRIYIIADTDLTLAYWKQKNYPLIAWSHYANREESLMGSSWMILSLNALTDSYLEEIHCRFYHLPLTICQTDQWLLRELTMEDLPHLIALDQEQSYDSAGRFFPFDISENYELQKQFLSDYIRSQYAFYGYGIYAAYEPEHHEFLGIVGLSSFNKNKMEDNKDNDIHKIEIGYAVKKKYQKNGLATAWVTAVISYAENELDIPRGEIVARIHPDNIVSVRVARKCGIYIFPV